MTVSDGTIGVLFVCMGNICRSPLAEGLFLARAAQRGVADRFEVDSAGTGAWHVGEQPDARVREVAARHNIILAGRARQVSRDDFDRFDHIICMDEDNRDRLARRGAPESNLRLLLEFDPTAGTREVPDPYFGGSQGFEIIYELIDSACRALLESLLAGRP